MGEVYRADDLRLGQAVALKFLPEAVQDDAARLSNLLNEVKLTRQISHPNVCRVYDIGEVDGRYFLTMEYVDGEDLATLLRRIGRLPKDKAVQIARQLCAGLAAAHEQGILHRDLKPGNVMIDGRGRARITDFGLAALAGEIHRTEARAGTPAYMSPEQLAGREISVRSDLYSLGLVLYELFTGQSAFNTATSEERRRLQQEATPARPSDLIEGFDSAVERVILRCLEKDPRDRPSSALVVAAALPGGDPLAAALAAGETPSPELVAEAGARGGLGPIASWLCLAAMLLGTGLLTAVSGKVSLLRRTPFAKPPDVLVDRAREVVRKLGYTSPPADSAYGFGTHLSYLRYVAEHDQSARRWEALAGGQPAAIFFWYRQSPLSLEPRNPEGTVGLEDPPPLLSGMVTVYLDPEGRLRQFFAVPPQVEDAKDPSPPPDWPAMFSEAGLDPSSFHPTASSWNPPVYADSRAAWEGVDPRAPGVPLRVEAAAYRGKAVYFQLLGPWSRPLRTAPLVLSERRPIDEYLVVATFLLILPAGVVLARRNLLRGRGDRKGAFRVAVYVFLVQMLIWLFQAHHVADPVREWWGVFLPALGEIVLLSGFIWIFYIALEPHVRRRWPETIISWSRFLAGRFRDPLVGRDLLIGSLFGAGILLAYQLPNLTPNALGLPPPAPTIPYQETLLGARASITSFLEAQQEAVFSAMALLFLLVLLRMFLRRQWIALGAYSLLLTFLVTPESLGSHPALNRISGGLAAVMVAIVAVRFGLLAMVACRFVLEFLGRFPLTWDLTAWYAGGCLFALFAVTALAVAGFYTSRRGQPLLGKRLLEE